MHKKKSLSALPRPAVPLPAAWGCEHYLAWFTFVSRATGLRAVGSSGWSLFSAVSRTYRLSWVAHLRPQSAS